MRPHIDGSDQTPDAGLIVYALEQLELVVDRRDDLLVDETAGIEGEIAEQEGGKQRKNHEIQQRELKCRGASASRAFAHAVRLCLCRADGPRGQSLPPGRPEAGPGGRTAIRASTATPASRSSGAHLPILQAGSVLRGPNQSRESRII